LTTATSNPTNASTIPVTVTFDESVSGFTAADITPTNATITGFAGSGAIYTFNLVPAADGTVSAAIAANVALDNAGNGNTAATTFSRTVARTGPTVSMTSATSNPTNVSTIHVSVAFSSAVADFDVTDITASNATVDAFAGT